MGSRSGAHHNSVVTTSSARGRGRQIEINNPDRLPAHEDDVLGREIVVSHDIGHVVWRRNARDAARCRPCDTGR